MGGVTQFTVDIEIGDRDILWTPLGGVQRNMGATKDGSVLHIEGELIFRKIHRFGDTAYQLYITVKKCWVSTILLQRSYENFELLLDGVMTNDMTGGAVDTIDGAIDADDTIITLHDMIGFTVVPESGYVVKIETEEILVRAVDVATKKMGTVKSPCERGYNGTNAASHLNDTVITMCETVIDLDSRPRAITKGRLTLRPVGETDDEHSHTLWLSHILPKFSIPLKINADQEFQTEFQGLFDENADGRVRIYRYGKLDVEEEDKSYFPQVVV